VSLPNRRYPGGGILTRGRRSRGHRMESPRDGDTRFIQLWNTCTMTWPTAACLKLFLSLLSGCVKWMRVWKWKRVEGAHEGWDAL
jgi:hypothetical protein